MGALRRRQWGVVVRLVGLGIPRLLAWRRSARLRIPPRAEPLVLLAVTVAGASLIFLHLSNTECVDRPARDRQMRRWSGVEVLEPGTRVTWVTDSRNWQYYRMFGRRLQLVPLRVERGGDPYQPLHLYWRETHPTWWASKSNEKSSTPKQCRKQEERKPNEHRVSSKASKSSAFVERLEQHDIQAVLLMKKKKRRWDRHYLDLKRSHRAQLLGENSASALFQLGREKQVTRATRPVAQRLKRVGSSSGWTLFSTGTGEKHAGWSAGVEPRDPCRVDD